MKTVVEMAREAGLHRQQHNLMSNPVQYRFSYDGYEENLERFAELVRADERNSWPAEMEAMERQVNILTDALSEALRMALEALEQWNTPLYKRGTVITAIKQALKEKP
jgi:hypothetical protein